MEGWPPDIICVSGVMGTFLNHIVNYGKIKNKSVIFQKAFSKFLFGQFAFILLGKLTLVNF